jgi:hypothetical protein
MHGGAMRSVHSSCRCRQRALGASGFLASQKTVSHSQRSLALASGSAWIVRRGPAATQATAVSLTKTMRIIRVVGGTSTRARSRHNGQACSTAPCARSSAMRIKGTRTWTKRSTDVWWIRCALVLLFLALAAQTDVGWHVSAQALEGLTLHNLDRGPWWARCSLREPAAFRTTPSRRCRRCRIAPCRVGVRGSMPSPVPQQARAQAQPVPSITGKQITRATAVLCISRATERAGWCCISARSLDGEGRGPSDRASDARTVRRGRASRCTPTRMLAMWTDAACALPKTCRRGHGWSALAHPVPVLDPGSTTRCSHLRLFPPPSSPPVWTCRSTQPRI